MVMTYTDWIIDIALIVIVLRQLREEKLTRRFVIIPIGIVAYVANTYLHGLPSGAANLELIAIATVAGTALGLIGGLLTRVRGENGAAYVKAGSAAAGLWVVSMTARLGFIVWITHTGGEQVLARFSAAHGITAADAWQTALVLLALSEVVARIGTIVVRGLLVAGATRNDQPTRPLVDMVNV